MTKTDEALLAEFSLLPACELCGRPREERERLDPNHILQRGAGGGSRLDLRENVVACCHEPCHMQYHDGRPGAPSHGDQRDRFLSIAARREGFASGPVLHAHLLLLLRTPNDAGERRPKPRRRRPKG